MIQRPTTITLGLAACLILSATTLAAQTAQQLVERLDYMRRPDKSFEATLSFTELHNGKPGAQTALHVMVRKIPNSVQVEALSQCLEPVADKGKLVLATTQGIWFLDPKSKRPTQVSAHHFKGKYFVGDTLSTSFAADYDTEMLGEETIPDASRKDVLCSHIRMKRRQKTGLTPEIVEYWMDKKLMQPIRGEFFTSTGKLLRTAYYAGYAKVLNEIRPTRVLVVSNTERGLVTDIKLSDFNAHEWPEGMFTKDAMTRVAAGELR